MPSNSPFEGEGFRDNEPIPRLHTSVQNSNKVLQEKDGNLRKNKEAENGSFFGSFSWPSGAKYEGEFTRGRRNGKGKQTWPDGGFYEGEFLNDMRHGQGVHHWKNGEIYRGIFYKDHRHGKGVYTWPDGAKFDGTFYLDKKEGYGKFVFANGDIFEGLYKSDERFGPGVMKYGTELHHGADVGIWHREKLIKLCLPVENMFTMKDHPEYKFFPDENKSRINLNMSDGDSIHNIFVRESSSYTFLSDDFKTSLFSEHTALPPGIETYSKDFEHLPLTKKHKEQLDKAFFGAGYDLVKKDDGLTLIATNNTPLMMDLQKHIHKYRFEAKSISLDVNSILNSNRAAFKQQPGHLETTSKLLIEKSACGDIRTVYSIIKSGQIDPNVSDCHGNVALHVAAVNCHHEVVNLLLDSGGNVNQLTDEGVSALNACHIFYYPVDHFKPNIGEQYIEKFRESKNTNFPVKKTRKLSVIRTTSPFRRMSAGPVRNREVLSGSPRSRSGSMSSVRSSGSSQGSSRAPSPKELMKDDIELCKSDLKIMKVRRNLMSAKSKRLEQERLEKQRLEEIENDSDDSESKQDTKPTFESDRNIFDLDLDVTDRLIERTATLLSLNDRAVSGVSTRDGKAMRLGTAGALAVWKAEHHRLRSMIELLLQRGANPDISYVPYSPLFFAVKGGDVDAVRLLLKKGSSTSARLSGKLGGLTPLHIACGIECMEGVEIVKLLLSANADANATANDKEMAFTDDEAMKTETIKSVAQKINPKNKWNEVGTQWVTEGLKFVEESGRTALHIACNRDDNYKDSRDITKLLVRNGANPDVIWSGHSPLSLSICSGNDLCLDELLEQGADASLPLTRGVGNALCVGANPKYEERREPNGRLILLEKLVTGGANMLAPVVFGAKNLTGTVVDYAHWMFIRDERIAHTPYHALTLKERDTYNARKQLLAHLGLMLRNSAVNVERERLKQEFRFGIKSRSPSRDGRFLYTGAGAGLRGNPPDPAHARSTLLDAPPVSRVSFVGPTADDDNNEQLDSSGENKQAQVEIESNLKGIKKKRRLSNTAQIRKPLFRYCYDCGRSVGVRLTSCSRCHEVYYCSRACKLKAWEDVHREECLRLKGCREQSPLPTSSEIAELFAEHTLDETMQRAHMKTTSIIDDIINQHIAVAEETALSVSRKSMYGSRMQAGRRTTSSRSRMLSEASGKKQRKLLSSKSEKRSDPQAVRKSGKKSGHPAKVSAKTRTKVGKDLEFGTAGLTLAELGIKENYSFN